MGLDNSLHQLLEQVYSNRSRGKGCMHVKANDQRRLSGPDKQVLSELQKYSESTIMIRHLVFFCPSPLNIKHAASGSN